jgi:PAS domain S-box-containing protein
MESARVSEEKRKHEDELSRAKDFAQRLFRLLPIPATLSDKEGRRLDANDKFLELLNRRKEECIDLPMEEMYVKEDIPKLKGALEECKRTGYSTCKTRVIRGDGAIVIYNLHFTALKDKKGNVLNILAAGLDISELHKYEEELKLAVSTFGGVLSKAATGDLSVRVELDTIGEDYRSIGENINSMIDAISEHEAELESAKLFNDLIIDNSTVPIVITDKNWKWIKVNPAFEELFGYKAEEVLGKSDYELPIWTAEEYKKVSDHVTRLTEEEGLGKPIEIETLCKTKDGRDLNILLKEIFLEEGVCKEIGFIGYLLDITELHRREEELKEIKESLEREAARIAASIVENLRRISQIANYDKKEMV